MSNRLSCRVYNARVRPRRRESLQDLLYKLFERRHHEYAAGPETNWLTTELVQALRRESDVYRKRLSTETKGPLPFALGYFQLQEGALRLTTRTVPANVDPKTLVRLLSEFVRPGAMFWFGSDTSGQGWEIRGVDDLAAIDKPGTMGSSPST